MLNIQTLIAAGIGPTAARAFADPLQAACQANGINTRARLAAFIAQASHESAGFTRLEENLFYTTPERIRAVFPTRVPSLADAAKLARNPQALANRVYSERLGNGDEASGDGWRFRGRGLFQLTGRQNYTLQGAHTDPDAVALPPGAAMTAARFWREQGLNELADSSQIDVITRRINGPAMLGQAERRSLFTHALQAFA